MSFPFASCCAGVDAGDGELALFNSVCGFGFLLFGHGFCFEGLFAELVAVDLGRG